MRKTKTKPAHLIPTEKLSKRKKRELARSRRGDWGGINPVTRMPMNSKAYQRNKENRLAEKEKNLWA